VHPFDSVPDPTKNPLTSELPADVALGKWITSRCLGSSDHKSTAEVWYKLLNCGFRLPTAAGTDFMGKLRVSARAGGAESRVCGSEAWSAEN